ncbi:MAG: LiaF transmembrane domain-containing protein [Candidatus Cryptobacteroides sp.]
MKQTLKTVFGLALIAAGVIGILVFSGVINLSFSIDGWWTLFIIIPCLGSLFSGKDIVGSLMGIGVGVLLLLAARGIIDWSKIWMYLIAVMTIGIGVKMVFNLGYNGCCGVKNLKSTVVDGKEIRHIENNFGQQKISFTGEKVEGLKVENNFGATCLDLRGAIIDSDIDIKVEVAFGGLEIYIPEGYVVKTAVSSGFGGVSDKRMSQADPTKPVIFITGNCGFGGIALR